MTTKKTNPNKSRTASSGSSKNSVSDSTDAVTLLKNDHERVSAMLNDLESTTERSVKRRRELLLAIGVEIRVHAGIEEEIFYPAFHAAGETKDDGKLFFEAAEEHALVAIVLHALEATEPEADEFGAKVKVLQDLIEHHAEEEEEEMFPRAKELLGRERLVELGVALRARQTALKAEVLTTSRGAPPSKSISTGRARASAGQAESVGN